MDTDDLGPLLAMRNHLFRRLVAQEGYRTIAIGSDCLAGLIVDDFVTLGTGSLDEAMERGFSRGWGEFEGNRELVRWMRDHNDGRPASGQVRFAGLDGPLEAHAAASPRHALTALHDHLSARVAPDLLPCTAEALDHLLGTDERWTDPAAMTDPSRSVGRSADAGQLRVLTGDLTALLDTQPPPHPAAREGWDRARLYGRTAAGLLYYHFWMAAPAPDRALRMARLRARMRADNLLALADRGPTLA